MLTFLLSDFVHCINKELHTPPFSAFSIILPKTSAMVIA